jgi:large subunit ribosomal protein L19
MNPLQAVEKHYLKKEIPAFLSGDTVRVQVKVVEGEKTRLQAFQGTVIQRKGSGLNATFTVRKVSGGVGVERVFPVHSPNVATITVLRRGKTRRARLFYLRERRGKAAKIGEKKRLTESPAPSAGTSA